MHSTCFFVARHLLIYPFTTQFSQDRGTCTFIYLPLHSLQRTSRLEHSYTLCLG
jgi:hypothetical protein